MLGGLRRVCVWLISRRRCGAQTGNDECSVCLLEQRVGDLAVVLECGHAFHKTCLVPWLERNCICPACRLPLNPAHATHHERLSGQRHRDLQEDRRRQRADEVRLSHDRMTEMTRQERERTTSTTNDDGAEGEAAASAAGPVTLPGDGGTGLNSREDLQSLGVRDLKKRLDKIGVSYAGLFEKTALVELYYKNQWKAK